MSHVPTHEGLLAVSLGSHTHTRAHFNLFALHFLGGGMRSCGKLIVMVYISVFTAYISV